VSHAVTGQNVAHRVGVAVRGAVNVLARRPEVRLEAVAQAGEGVAGAALGGLIHLMRAGRERRRAGRVLNMLHRRQKPIGGSWL
jgi:hypothetical protein